MLKCIIKWLKYICVFFTYWVSFHWISPVYTVHPFSCATKFKSQTMYNSEENAILWKVFFTCWVLYSLILNSWILMYICQIPFTTWYIRSLLLHHFIFCHKLKLWKKVTSCITMSFFNITPVSKWIENKFIVKNKLLIFSL